MNPQFTITPGAPAPPRSYSDDPARAPWGLREIILAVLITLAALVLVFVVAGLVLAGMGISANEAEDDEAGTIVLLLSQVALDAVAVIAAAGVSLWRFGVSARAWGFRKRSPIALGACAQVLFLSFAALFVYGIVVRTLGLDALEPESNVPEELFDQGLVVPFTILLVVVVAPLAEESFFRGFMFNGLRGTRVVDLLALFLLLAATVALTVLAFTGMVLEAALITAVLGLGVMVLAVSRPATLRAGPGGLYRETAAAIGRRVPVLGARAGMYGAALASGFVFSIIHVNSADLIGLVVPFTIIGFLFAVVAGRTGSIWNAILVHFAFNSIGVAAQLATGTVLR
jgi:membrane protease YdiL (CAAX protease family)